METNAVFVVPNTKDGLYAVKYLAKEIMKNNLLIKLVSKKEFDSHVEALEKENEK